MNNRLPLLLVMSCISLAIFADEVRRYDGRTYDIEVCLQDGVIFPTVHFSGRIFRFAYRTDGYGTEGEHSVKFHGMKSRNYSGEVTKKGFCASFIHDLHLVDGNREKVGEAKTEIRCTDGLIGVQTTVTPVFPGRFTLSHDLCFSQVVTFPDFLKWIGTTLLTTDAAGTSRMNQLMAHEEFDLCRWGMNGRDLRTVVLGNVPEVMTFQADRMATLTINRYRGGFECNAALKHPHPGHYPMPWNGPMTYRYLFKLET